MNLRSVGVSVRLVPLATGGHPGFPSIRDDLQFPRLALYAADGFIDTDRPMTSRETAEYEAEAAARGAKNAGKDVPEEHTEDL